MKKILPSILLAFCLVLSFAGGSLAQGETITLMGISVDLSLSLIHI